MNRQTRKEIVDGFRKQVAEGKILVGVGAGTGITAKSSEAGGADMLIIYNSKACLLVLCCFLKLLLCHMCLLVL